MKYKIMKIIDERETQRKQRQKRTRPGGGGYKSYSESVSALGFLQIICKASLIFSSNLELALSITLKQRELYVNACCGGV